MTSQKSKNFVNLTKYRCTCSPYFYMVLHYIMYQ